MTTTKLTGWRLTVKYGRGEEWTAVVVEEEAAIQFIEMLNQIAGTDYWGHEANKVPVYEEVP